MKRRPLVQFVAVAAIAVCGATVMALVVDRAPEAEKGTIVGEVIDIGNYAMKGEHGEVHAAAGLHRLGQGFPVGILEEGTDRVYVAIYRQPVPAAALQTANAALTPYMGKKVVIQGLKYHAVGINLVNIGIVSEY